MLSVPRVATTPLKSASWPHPSAYFTADSRTAFTAVLIDASHSPADDHPPAATCHLKGALTCDIQRLPLNPFPTRPLQVCDINSDARNTTTANPDVSPNSSTSHSNPAPNTYPCSIFPVHGPFDLFHCLQSGAFADAWAAKDNSTGRLLCLKVFHSVQDPDVSRSVRTELAAFRRIVKSKRGEQGKQFIIELNRSMQYDNVVFFAMELLSTDLASYFGDEPERCKLHARRWMAQIALGIQSLHEMAIIHRDIKSENILIDAQENIRIIDFGLAQLGSTSKPVRAIEFLGTPPYMAPEILRNMGLPVDRRMYYDIAVDWWALGCIFYELESPDHELLFDTDDDLAAYVEWTLRSGRREQDAYSRFESLDPVVVNLLEGLLQVHPFTRFSLKDMEKHVYFLHRDGTNEFDNAAARARERHVRPELVPRFTCEDRQPIKVVEAPKAATSNDWINLKWALADV